jgi:hypothetical protein
VEKSDKIRIAGYSIILIGLLIMIFGNIKPLINGNGYDINTSFLYYGEIAGIIGGVINSIGYRMEKKAFDKELREKGAVPN